MGQNVTLSQEFRLMTCPVCGIAYALPEWYIQTRQNKGGSWHCPNGDRLSFTVTENDRLKKELEAANNRANQREYELQQARLREEKANREKARLAKRLKAGVCPVSGCKRHFTNLQRHLQTEHAGVAIEESQQGTKLLTQ